MVRERCGLERVGLYLGGGGVKRVGVCVNVGMTVPGSNTEE